ncbi:hypothetical protein DL766_005775 [Monosporascus sp. MC13-8B]|uniref:Thioredoxin-like fold domain-containing protein n=1 Tax=Monosporascus cannonballus TaxID=155416 RepID=A0ABY0HES6_9PEZI|nr:hypothetical protein DL763_006410 [Monosporascus cannonballus]RYO91793.1 hypothetical protein DL762_002012 [Monosporascus cannonballus]RYP28622.1 hypothetical protein DL766_005775 [Monosporascus sp. MC13-8B]
MAVPPKFAGLKLQFSAPPLGDSAGVPPQLHTLEVYLDYVCPFSARQFATLYHEVVPLVRSNPAWASKLQIVLRPQVQPWHPSSTLTHEAAVAVLQLAPAKFWAFSDALFRDQKAYFDVSVVNETRNQTYRRLARLAAQSVGVDEEEVYARLAIPEKADDEGALNVGNKVTNDLKVLVKMARLVGVHVSPTVVFDGVTAGDISSSWTKDQWEEWLKKNIA